MANQDGSYGQYCPISRAVEVLGERWTILIVRDLLCGSTRFNELARGNPGLSRPLLTKRLRQLERAGIVCRADGHYLLTEAGKDLRPVVFGLGEWGARWQFGDPRTSELDPELLMWWVHDRLDLSVLDQPRIVMEFRFRRQAWRCWIVADGAGPSVCTSDPGFETDVIVDAELSALYQVWLGRLDLRQAMHDGSVTLIGDRTMIRRMPDVMQLSLIAPAVAAQRPTG